jgi:hypothetical protein
MEKAACDFLHLNAIKHQREPRYPLDPELNVHGLRRADWLLDEDTLVEFWGLPNQADYSAKMQEKRKLAPRHGLTLVELVAADLRRLPRAFAPWMPASDPGSTAWSWSPVQTLEPTTLPVSANSNEYKSTLQLDRIERCRQAVMLQAEGHSRKAISRALSDQLLDTSAADDLP